jgi:hypothetical protein
MESRIYISQGGNSFGPYTETECIQMVQSGIMSPTDFACRYGMNQWLPLSEIIPGVLRVRTAPVVQQPVSYAPPAPTPTLPEESVGQVVGQMAVGCLVWLGVLGLAIGGGVIFPLLLILAPIALIGGAIDLIGKLIRAIRRGS